MRRATPRRAHKNVLIGEKTRVEILGVAEKLFAEYGPAAVSIRLIAQRAKVNLAAVNYHFGTKEKLLYEVFKRRVIPLNEKRAALMEECATAAEAAGVAPVLEDVIRAIVEPSVRLYIEAGASARTILIMQFLRRAQAQTGKRDPLEEYYGPVRARLASLIRRCLPRLAEADLIWRMNFLTGVLLYTMVGPVATGDKAPRIDRPVMQSSDEMIEQIVTYVAAGFRAPASSTGDR
jgi:AcrR family transcriptional regulator